MFFPTNQGLADILGRTDLHSENLHFSDFGDSRFPDFQIPGFPDSQMSRLSAIDSQSILRDGSAVAPRCSRTTKCRRSKELGQYRENPISASPVWGMFGKRMFHPITCNIRNQLLKLLRTQASLES